MISDEERARALKLGLKEKLSGTLLTDAVSLGLYASDASMFMVTPLAVVIPKDAEDIATTIELARENKIGVHPRGGATGLAGESLGQGIVLDCHPSFDVVGDLDESTMTIEAGAGACLAKVNAMAAKAGLMFGPDPASGNRATIGGMIGTNSTGAHSLVYGYTAEHLEAATLIDAAGVIRRLKTDDIENQPDGWRAVAKIVERHEAAIKQSYPDCPRNRAGYNLCGLVDEGMKTLAPLKLLAGAEGTLGIVTSAKLKLVDKPKHRGLVMFLFDNLIKAGEGVKRLMEFRPSAVELIDDHVLEMGRIRDGRFSRLLPESVKAVLLAEWTARDMEQLRDVAESASYDLQMSGLLAFDIRAAFEPEEAEVLWRIRKEAEALVMNRPGRRKAVSFVEDTAVHHGKLPQWLETMAKIFNRHGLSFATFGHAGHGEMHTKLFIDPFEPFEYSRLVRCAEEVYQAVIELGGTISGEHGDGLLRSFFLPAQYPDLVCAFEEVKRAIDPDGVLNPGRKTGKIKAHPAFESTRLSGRKLVADFQPLLRFRENELKEEAAACHGCGQCRADTGEYLMCPLYHVTHVEQASPRAIGNLSRLTLMGDLPLDLRTSEAAKAVADFCFNCKMCLSECPSHVNIPKLALELKAEQKKADGLGLGEKMVVYINSLSRMGTSASPIANTFIRSETLRSLGEAMAGIERHVKLFRFESGSLAKKLAKIEQPKSEKKLIYYVDYYALYHHHRLALDFVRLMNALGFEVIPFTAGGSGMPALDMGHPKHAARIAKSQAKKLAPFALEGLPIVCTEPTAGLAIREEWPSLIDMPEAAAVGASIREATEFMWELFRHEDISLPLAPIAAKVAHHEPCHLKFAKLGRPAVKLLSRIPQLRIEAVDEGCCGMAGAWGIFKKNRKRSKKIGYPLVKRLKTGGFDGAVTECSTCRLQIENGAPQLKVTHPIRLLAKAWREAESAD